MDLKNCNNEVQPNVSVERVETIMTTLNELAFETIIKNIKTEQLQGEFVEYFDVEDTFQTVEQFTNNDEHLNQQDNSEVTGSLNERQVVNYENQISLKVSKVNTQKPQDTQLSVSSQTKIKNTSNLSSYQMPTKLPTNTSQFKQVTHVCSECCAICENHFAVLDNPNHISPIQNNEKTSALIKIQPSLKYDSCICDRCWKYLEKSYKSNKNENRKRINITSDSMIVKRPNLKNTKKSVFMKQNEDLKEKKTLCSVHKCSQTFTFTLSKDEYLKILEIISTFDSCGLTLIEKTSDSNIYLHLCTEHKYLIDVMSSCQICGQKLLGKIDPDGWKEYAKWNFILFCSKIPLVLVPGMFICLICRFKISECTPKKLLTVDHKIIKKRHDACFKLFGKSKEGEQNIVASISRCNSKNFNFKGPLKKVTFYEPDPELSIKATSTKSHLKTSQMKVRKERVSNVIDYIDLSSDSEENSNENLRSFSSKTVQVTDLSSRTTPHEVRIEPMDEDTNNPDIFSNPEISIKSTSTTSHSETTQCKVRKEGVSNVIDYTDLSSDSKEYLDTSSDSEGDSNSIEWIELSVSEMSHPEDFKSSSSKTVQVTDLSSSTPYAVKTAAVNKDSNDPDLFSDPQSSDSKTTQFQCKKEKDSNNVAYLDTSSDSEIDDDDVKYLDIYSDSVINDTEYSDKYSASEIYSSELEDLDKMLADLENNSEILQYQGKKRDSDGSFKSFSDLSNNSSLYEVSFEANSETSSSEVKQTYNNLLNIKKTNVCEVKPEPTDEDFNDFNLFAHPEEVSNANSKTSSLGTVQKSNVSCIEKNNIGKCGIKLKLIEHNEDKSRVRLDNSVNDTLDNFSNVTFVANKNIVATNMDGVESDYLPLCVSNPLDNKNEISENSDQYAPITANGFYKQCGESFKVDSSMLSVASVYSKAVCNDGDLETNQCQPVVTNACSKQTKVHVNQNNNINFDKGDETINVVCNIGPEFDRIFKPYILNKTPIRQLQVRANPVEIKKKPCGVLYRRISNDNVNMPRQNDNLAKLNETLMGDSDDETNSSHMSNFIESSDVKSRRLFENGVVDSNKLVRVCRSNYNNNNKFDSISNSSLNFSSNDEMTPIPTNTSCSYSSNSSQFHQTLKRHLYFRCERTFRKSDLFSVMPNYSPDNNIPSKQLKIISTNPYSNTQSKIVEVCQSSKPLDNNTHCVSKPESDEKNETSIVYFRLNNSNKDIYKSLETRFDDSTLFKYLMEVQRMFFNGELVVSKKASRYATNYLNKHKKDLYNWYGDPKYSNAAQSFLKPGAAKIYSRRLAPDRELTSEPMVLHSSPKVLNCPPVSLLDQKASNVISSKTVNTSNRGLKQKLTKRLASVSKPISSTKIHTVPSLVQIPTSIRNYARFPVAYKPIAPRPLIYRPVVLQQRFPVPTAIRSGGLPFIQARSPSTFVRPYRNTQMSNIFKDSGKNFNAKQTN